MKHKENEMVSALPQKEERKKQILKETVLFPVICLPVTWLLGWIAYDGLFKEEVVSWANSVHMVACFMPAITAVLLCILTKESIWDLQFMPKLQKNAGIYFMTILLGVLVIGLEILPTPYIFPKMASFSPEVTGEMMFYVILSVISASCVQFFVGMGEELGWMGYLYPRMEKLFGLAGAVILSILIRVGWHLMMTPWDEHLAYNMFMRCLLHIMLVCVGVWLTKKSGSVVPVSLFHCLLNGLTFALGECIVVDNAAYEANRYVVDLVRVIPLVIVGVFFFLVLKKTNASSVVSSKEC